MSTTQLEAAPVRHATPRQPPKSRNRWLFHGVMIPFTLPYVATGIRQATARGLVGMVAAEFFLSPSGLGQLIIVGSYNFDTAAMLAAVLVVVVLGVTLMEAGHYLESRLAVWRRSAP